MPRWTAARVAIIESGVRILVSRTLCGQRKQLTVEDTYQVDLQGRELGRNGLAIHHVQGTITNAKGDFGDSGVWDLVMDETLCWVWRTEVGETKAYGPQHQQRHSARTQVRRGKADHPS